MQVKFKGVTSVIYRGLVPGTGPTPRTFTVRTGESVNLPDEKCRQLMKDYPEDWEPLVAQQPPSGPEMPPTPPTPTPTPTPTPMPAPAAAIHSKPKGAKSNGKSKKRRT